MIRGNGMKNSKVPKREEVNKTKFYDKNGYVYLFMIDLQVSPYVYNIQAFNTNKMNHLLEWICH